MAPARIKCHDRSVQRNENGEAMYDEHEDVITKPCAHWAMTGLDHCFQHATHQERHRLKIDKYLRTHQKTVANLLSQLDIVESNPLDGLLEAVRYSGAMMRMLLTQVGDLEMKPDLQSDNTLTESLWGPDHNGDAAPHVLVNLLGIWTDRYTKACKLALDAGIDERIVRNAEMTSMTLITAVERGIDQVKLSPEEKIAIKQAIAAAVRAAVGGAATDTENPIKRAAIEARLV